MAALLRNDCGGDVVVVGVNKDGTGTNIARDAGIATFAVGPGTSPTAGVRRRAGCHTEPNRPDLVVLAAFSSYSRRCSSTHLLVS